MRKIKIPEARQRVIECHKCRCVTLTLVRKEWVKKPLRSFTELRGYYKCTNCGINCSKVLATEPI